MWGRKYVEIYHDVQHFKTSFSIFKKGEMNSLLEKWGGGGNEAKCE